MRTVDRNGVHIEQCGRCRGIFLDHGELEAIANAERHFYAPPTAGGRHDSPPPYRGGHGGHGGYRDSPAPYRGGHGGYGGHYGDSPPHYGHGGHRRRKSFLEQLFD